MKRFSLLATALLAAVLLTKVIEEMPWYTFVFPCMVIGFIVRGKFTSRLYFSIAFLVGLVTWVMANVWFHFTYDGTIHQKLNLVQLVFLLVISGVMCGILMAMSIHLGVLISRMVIRKPRHFPVEPFKP
ncbi:MAG: hypothetical protein CMH44_05945 [Muricauda sp.]|nr:hypothetical protein [Allomuricauda sp.]